MICYIIIFRLNSTVEGHVLYDASVFELIFYIFPFEFEYRQLWENQLSGYIPDEWRNMKNMNN
jgi:hypothetical protein